MIQDTMWQTEKMRHLSEYSLHQLFKVSPSHLGLGNNCYFLLLPNGYFSCLGQYSKSYNGNEYSEQTLSVACVASALISLLLGFLGGFLFTKKCSSQDLGPRCGHSYLEAQILER